jgi:hypothetical protein
MLVLLLLQSNPPSLLSNLTYLSNFRPAERLANEDGYFFISLVSAVTFVQVWVSIWLPFG